MKAIVASINFHPDHAGIGVYSTDFAKYISDVGDDITVVTAFPYYPYWRKKKKDLRKFFRVDKVGMIPVFRSYIYVPQNPTVLRRFLHELSFTASSIIGFLRAGRPDIIIVFSPPLGLIAVASLFSWLWNIPFAVNVQDLPVDAAHSLGMMRGNFLFKIFSYIEVALLKRASLVSSISQNMMVSLISKGLAGSRLSLVPNWIDLDEDTQAIIPGRFREKMGINSNSFLIAYAGNIGVKQGVEVLVELAKSMQLNCGIEFLIIGDGADLSRLKALATKYSLSNLKFLPFLNHAEYIEMLHDVDLVFLAQRSGSGDNFFPSKLLGLMKLGKPLLVSADLQSELAKTVSSGGFGIVSPYGDIESLAEQVHDFISGNVSCEAFSIAARSAVVPFNREQVLSRWRTELVSLIRAH